MNHHIDNYYGSFYHKEIFMSYLRGGDKMSDGMNDSESGTVYCWKCGARISKDAVFCPKCGERQNKTNAESNYEDEYTEKKDDPSVSSKSRLIACLLCFFLGCFGAHRFYVGKTGSAIAMILVNWLTLGIWALVDFIIICCGTFTDSEGKIVSNWDVN
jgi:TM2 domain-containing membrane protein YozV